MARATWSGAISFGLVNIPVKAYTAVREHTIHFNQLEKDSGSRIRYEKVSEKSGKEVESSDIELGYEVGRGRYVVVDPDELADLRPRTTRTIDIGDFVDLGDIDPIYYNRTYWLAPDGDAAVRAYRLLLAAMEDQKRVGIGTVVMRRKQYLAAIRPLDGALGMATMHFADEIVPQSDIDRLPRRRAKVDARERRLAAQIVGSLTTDWDPKRYHDTYTEELRDLIDRRSKGETVVVEEAPAARANVTDLMDALQASLDAAKKAKKAKAGDVSREVEAMADQLAAEQEREQGDDEADDDGAGTGKKPGRGGGTKSGKATAAKGAAAKKAPAGRSA
jgi:DNA end-binding protein Ku